MQSSALDMEGCKLGTTPSVGQVANQREIHLKLMILGE